MELDRQYRSVPKSLGIVGAEGQELGSGGKIERVLVEREDLGARALEDWVGSTQGGQIQSGDACFRGNGRKKGSTTQSLGQQLASQADAQHRDLLSRQCLQPGLLILEPRMLGGVVGPHSSSEHDHGIEVGRGRHIVTHAEPITGDFRSQLGHHFIKAIGRLIAVIDDANPHVRGHNTVSVASSLVQSLAKVGAGKVRDIYALSSDRLLIVASDRISAYDVVLDDEIPDKGRILTGLSRYFFDLLEVPNHFLTLDLEDLGALEEPDRRWLAGRAMVVRRAEVVPMECVVRGYLYGSAWREYKLGGGPTTEHFPKGLRLADRLPEPIFTPATKADQGHDENLDETGARQLVGADLYEELRSRSLEIYHKAAAHAETRGVILADTKFEFGYADGELLLIDEVLTPDSSRYWPADSWQPGTEVPSFDKQYVRDWLDSSGWNHTSPAPALPPDVVRGTRERYVEAFERISGTAFDRYLDDVT